MDWPRIKISLYIGAAASGLFALWLYIDGKASPVWGLAFGIGIVAMRWLHRVLDRLLRGRVLRNVVAALFGLLAFEGGSSPGRP